MGCFDVTISIGNENVERGWGPMMVKGSLNGWWEHRYTHSDCWPQSGDNYSIIICWPILWQERELVNHHKIGKITISVTCNYHKEIYPFPLPRFMDN